MLSELELFIKCFLKRKITLITKFHLTTMWHQESLALPLWYKETIGQCNLNLYAFCVVFYFLPLQLILAYTLNRFLMRTNRSSKWPKVNKRARHSQVHAHTRREMEREIKKVEVIHSIKTRLPFHKSTYIRLLLWSRYAHKSSAHYFWILVKVTWKDEFYHSK